MAAITVNGQGVHLGYFDTPEAAAAVYDKASHVYFGDFARPNQGGEA